MGDKVNEDPKELSDSLEASSRPRRLWSTLRRTAEKAGETVGEAARVAGQAGGQAARSAVRGARGTIGDVQRKLGEDYYAILAENPLIVGTLSSSSLLEEDALLRTVFNVPWATTLFWSAASGSAIALQRPIAQEVGGIVHDHLGHVKRWDDVNKFMDSVRGAGHRLKFGHSIEYLPEIVERFGVEGVPAYFVHLIQDFTTIDGVPVIPDAWRVKKVLEFGGVPAKVATGLVSISFSSTLGALGVIGLVHHLWTFGSAFKKRRKTGKYLKTASAAIQCRDYNAAIANYRRALEVERNPLVLMSLGRVYMQRAKNRLRAHKSFLEASRLLADRPALTIPYGHAQLSARGLAAVHALATADVLADMHPEHWNDHVQDLVNAAVFSFSSAASRAADQSDDLVPDVVVTPSYFSASINYMLAARSASLYPFAEQRQETVVRNIQSSSRSLGLVAQYDEEQLRQPTNTIRQLWSLELLPPEEAEIALAAY